MTDRPILFSAPMVNALLSGTKTQTRRIIKPNKHGYYPIYFGNKIVATVFHSPIVDSTKYAHGDRLYVRESFSYNARDRIHNKPISCWYWADGPLVDANGNPMTRPKPKPSIHMPRWASRMTLEVTGVKVERVQDISEEDAGAEGHPQRPEISNDQAAHDDAARDWFADLWDSINKKRGYGWRTDPFVAAVSFKVHKINIDAMEKAE